MDRGNTLFVRNPLRRLSYELNIQLKLIKDSKADILNRIAAVFKDSPSCPSNWSVGTFHALAEQWEMDDALLAHWTTIRLTKLTESESLRRYKEHCEIDYRLITFVCTLTPKTLAELEREYVGHTA